MFRGLPALLALALPCFAADFYVSPQGNDSWSGTLDSPNAAGMDGPFASIAKAQSAVQSLKAAHPNTPITIMLRGGTYYLPLSPTSPGALSFSSADSGADAGRITWTNFPNETPVINGGIPIGTAWNSEWTNEGNGLWSIPVPDRTANFEFL